MCIALNILGTYGAVSGLKLNVDKCEGFWLGKNKKLQKKPHYLELNGLTNFDI